MRLSNYNKLIEDFSIADSQFVNTKTRLSVSPGARGLCAPCSSIDKTPDRAANGDRYKSGRASPALPALAFSRYFTNICLHEFKKEYADQLSVLRGKTRFRILYQC